MKKIVLLLLCFCLISSCANSDTVATVGNTKITKGELEFYLSSIKSQLSGTELETEEDWQTQEIEGEKAIDVAKQRALQIAVLNAEYCEIAKAQNIQFTEKEQENINSTKQQVISSYGGNEAYKKFLKDNNITDSFIQLICESTVYYEKLSEKLLKEEPITEADIRKYYDNNKPSLNAEYKKAKHILILTKDMASGKEYDEETLAQKKALADELFERIKAGEDFDKLMHEYSEDPGLTTNPQGYVFTSGEMVSEFEQAVESVSEGEVTLCKSAYGYHIIKRLPVEFSDISDKLNDAVIKELIDNKLKEWEKEYNIAVTVNEEILKGIK